MSKRGRRRSSRRKSSSSSKQSISSYVCLKRDKKNSVSYKDDIAEKGESDSLRRENAASDSEDEEKRDSSPAKDKNLEQDYPISPELNQRSIYTKTTEDEETGVTVVTSVSVSDLKDASPQITFQQLHKGLCEKPANSSMQVKIDCAGSNVKLEIQEIVNSSGVKTTFVFMNETGANGERDGTKTPDNELCELTSRQVTNVSGDHNANFSFSISSTSDRSESISPTRMWYNPTSQCYVGQNCQQATDSAPVNRHPTSSLMLNSKPQEKREHLCENFSMEQFWDIPPPQDFADVHYNTLGELRQDLDSCVITTRPDDNPMQERQVTPNVTYSEESTEERANLTPLFDNFSESDHYDDTFARPSLSTNRSSFTKDFISSQKRKSWIRNNSFAAVEHRACPLPQKRRQTFPGMSEGLGFSQEDLLLPCTESFTSMIMCSYPPETDNLYRTQQIEDKYSDESLKTKESSRPDSEIPEGHNWKEILSCPSGATSSEDNPVGGHSKKYHCPGLQESFSKEMDSIDTDNCDVVDSGIDQEVEEVEYHNSKLVKEDLDRILNQVLPPSCGDSEEGILHNNPPEDSVPALSEHKSSVTTLHVGDMEQRFLQMDIELPQSGQKEVPLSSTLEEASVSPSQDGGSLSLNSSEVPEPVKEKGSTSSSQQSMTKEIKNLQQATRRSAQAEIHRAEEQIVPGCSTETKNHLKLVMHKDLEGDHWAKRRKIFKESKQWSSAGGNSITSDITEESVSEDAPSLDRTNQDSEGGDFYTETFHSSAWLYQGDDVGTGVIPPNLNARTRPSAIRERTVRINKGSGEYPWGFRIQFSKPIVVTEVDTNGAAEEAGLTVGDFVLAVNGTDVTSIPHSEAANLARQGPDVLTLTIGSDIARSPNTPRPVCRGYLHKRTQSGLIKGWRKRWFVLTHHGCLYYYRHKRDEGKRPALSALKLEGSEVGPDVSLGKPFVFKCRPHALNRVFFFCATSNQEMKRWLEAMERAIHPILQNHVWVDVTRHNSNLPPLAVKNPECLGLLHKMHRNKDTWVQHYCILKDACLYLYSGIRATHARGGIYLHGYTVREQPYTFKKSTIELKPLSDEFPTFHLCADNPNENKRWIVAMKASIKKWLPLHQALQDYMNRPPEETRM